MDSLTFLERLGKAKVQPLYVLHGDEHFLKRQVLAALRTLVLGPSEDGFAAATYPGDKATWSAVLDELQTLPFLAPRRLVVVEGADPFVSRERARLEKFVAALGERPDPSGVLVLEVNSWAANTRLARLVPDAGSITCKAPAAHHLPDWCVKWCAAGHGKTLAAAAARLLVDLVGAEMGLLDQELGKLAVYVGPAPRIEADDVDVLVGRSRAEDTWRIFDLIGSGKAGEALAFLGRLLDQGSEPLGLLSGPFSWQLRRIAQAGRLCLQGVPLSEALDRAGVPNFPAARRGAEQMMRHLGRRRLDRLYDQLVQADLDFKGSSQLPPRTLLERFVVQLARPRGPS
jgi:DNA polymerase-3 subunit delta